MNQERGLRTLKSHSKKMRTQLTSSLITWIIFIPTSLFSQVKSGSSEKAGVEHASTSNIIIHQEIDFKVAPRQLYQTLLSSKEFSACIKMSFPNFTEMSATIDSTVGGAFSLFDGHIIGRILELIP